MHEQAAIVSLKETAKAFIFDVLAEICYHDLGRAGKALREARNIGAALGSLLLPLLHFTVNCEKHLE